MRVREKDDRGVVQAVVLFLGVSVLSGALAAGLAIPFAGLAGFGTEKASETFEQLPQQLKEDPPPVRSSIRAANGKPIANLYEQNRVMLKSLNDVAPIMKKAIIAIEDSRYYEHGALDAKGTLRALMRNQSEGSVQQGGSSITQQYVKLVLVEQAKTDEERKAATAETYERKLRELRYAVAIEKQYSKDEILLKYLNLANFGDGAYGIEAAARHYFGVTAKTLNLQQAAILAGLVKNPSGYNPTSYPAEAKARRDVVLRRMQELSIVTKQQADAAVKTPVIDMKKVQPVPNGCANAGTYAFFCEYVLAELLKNPNLGKTPDEREHFIKSAGITITTSIDPDIQADAQAAVYDNSQPTDQAMAALSIVEPGTGLVKAMAQSRPYGNNRAAGQTTWNYNVEKSYGSGYGGFQNGSTMKAFTLAAAIQQGVPLNHRINSPQTINLSGAKFRTCKGTVSAPKYTPSNSTTGGNLTLMEATAYSTNTYFLQLSRQIGLCGPSTLATQLGVVNGKTEGDTQDRRTDPGGPFLDSRHRQRHPVGHGQRVRDLRGPGQVLRDGDRHLDQGQDRQEHPHPWRQLQAGHGAGPRRRRQPRPPRSDAGQGHRRPSELRAPGRRQDRHHQRQHVRLVRGLHPELRSGSRGRRSRWRRRRTSPR